MTAPRKPAAFRIEPEAAPRQDAPEARKAEPSRKAGALKTDVALVIPAEIDVFDEPDIVAAEPPPAIAPMTAPTAAPPPTTPAVRPLREAPCFVNSPVCRS